MEPARFPPEKAEPARLEAWLNLSAREKAREFMIVKTSAMTKEEEGAKGQILGFCCPAPRLAPSRRRQLTNERYPQELEPEHGYDCHDYPDDGLAIHGQPKEPAVGWVDDLCAGFTTLKHPFGVARIGVDLVPPPKTDEAAARNVFRVIKVGGEEEHRYNEDHDPRRGSSAHGGSNSLGEEALGSFSRTCCE